MPPGALEESNKLTLHKHVFNSVGIYTVKCFQLYCPSFLVLLITTASPLTCARVRAGITAPAFVRLRTKVRMACTDLISDKLQGTNLDVSA